LAESLSRKLPEPAATAQFGALLARVLLDAAPPSLVFYFEGELGAGKTALIRSMLAGLGHKGRVPSPTYTLVEPYLVDAYRVLHVDLYRLRDPAELDHLGLADELGPVDALGRGSLLLAEWPSRGAGRMPPGDLECRLDLDGAGRRVCLTALSEAGSRLLNKLHQALPVGF
jgi:tRNA threonylcarbamoyladenosine biosynthesis protein TsaE